MKNKKLRTTSCILIIVFVSLFGTFGTSMPIEPIASIGDFVWEDLDMDGIQDAGEPGIGGVTVILYDGVGTFIASMLTNSVGYYLFSNLVPGDYQVEFVLPEGYSFSLQDQGVNDAIDSDADPSTGKAAVTTLADYENDMTWDAGMYQEPVIELASIGDFVWEDLDMDGIQDEGELGVAGVIVNLFDGIGGLLASMATDGSGVYLFSDLVPGDYQVGFILPDGYEFSPQDQGIDEAIDSDANPSSGLAAVTTLDAGEDDLTWDAGIYMPSGDFEGYSPGYWKKHTDEWVGYIPEQTLDSIFTFPPELASLADDTLMAALKYGGGKGIIGKAKNLLRGAVAAVINAASPEINYPLSLTEIINAVNAALASLNTVLMGDLQKELDGYNNLGVS